MPTIFNLLPIEQSLSWAERLISPPSPLTPPPPHLPHDPLVDLLALEHDRVVQLSVVFRDSDDCAPLFYVLQPLDGDAAIHPEDHDLAVEALYDVLFVCPVPTTCKAATGA